MFEGASKQTPDLKILPRPDRALPFWNSWIRHCWPRYQFDNTLYKSCTTEGGSLSDSKYYAFFILEVMTDVNLKKKMVKCQDKVLSLPKNVSMEMNHIYFNM